MSDRDPATGNDDMHPVARILFGWVEAPNTPKFIFWGIAALAALLLIADPLRDIAHAKEDLEKIFGAYGWYGFLAFASVVLTGWPLGRLLRRGENYYGDLDEAPEDEEAS
ncbi:MAG: hypothetical protein AAFX02_01265 [Pseudomonadota bacterium]